MPQTLKKSSLSIPMQLKAESGSYAGQIVKLTLQGFLAEVSSTVIQTGERFEVSFSLPAELSGGVITDTVIIVKIYSQWSAAPASTSASTPASSPANAPATVARLIEAHFAQITPKTRSAVAAFLSATLNADKN